MEVTFRDISRVCHLVLCGEPASPTGLCGLGFVWETQFHCITQVGLELTTLLPQCPESWAPKCTLEDFFFLVYLGRLSYNSGWP